MTSLASLHPLVVLGERIGRENAVAVLGVIVVAVLAGTPDDSVEGLFVLVVAAAILVSAAWVAERDEPDDEIERVRDAYVHGEISLAEYERRIEVLLDDEAQRIRDVVEEINGVGPETSAAIALQFDSVAEIETATREDLQEVHGVGESTSEAIVEHVERGGLNP